MKNIILFISFLILPFFIFSQNDYDLNLEIPLDPKVRIGQLENGLTYYIRENSKPENRAELRLVVNAGSLLESEKQQGLAHFVEHMAFNGTAHFEKNELIQYLQTSEVKFGAHLNAYTSFDETVYKLFVPTDDTEVWDNAFLILQDWAMGLSFDAEEIDKERGIVVEEWRSGQGANNRMFQEYFPVLLRDSRYAERLPIGKKDILENFKHKELIQFYEDWYRPDLMAIVIVGDVDLEETEQKIQDIFSQIPKSKKPKERTEFSIENHPETLVSIVDDPEATNTNIQVYWKHPVEKMTTLKDVRQQLIHSLYRRMLNERLYEIAQKANPPFIYAGVSYAELVRTMYQYSTYAGTSDDEILDGLKAILTENERVKRFGFTEVELERQKTKILLSYENSFKERNTTESSRYVNAYVNHFLKDKPFLGVEFSYPFAQAQLPSITLEEVNTLAEAWMPNENRVVIITMPEKEGVIKPTEEEVRNIFGWVAGLIIRPYEEEEVSAELLTKIPEAGKIVKEELYKTLNLTEITLENGITVFLKPTDFKEDEIQLTGYSLGGHSLYGEDDFLTAYFTDAFMSESGLVDFTPTQLRRILADKKVYLEPYISDLDEGFIGNAVPKDLETLFQLLHLYFTKPRKDFDTFQSYIQRFSEYFKNLAADPETYFYDKLYRELAQNHYRSGFLLKEEDWASIDFERSFEIFQERFQDPSSFTFFIVGNFEVDSVKNLIQTYLGSLPKRQIEETWTDVGERPPKGIIKKEYFKGSEPKSKVSLYFTGECDFSWEAEHRLTSLKQILSIKLLENLREEMSEVYGVQVAASMDAFPYAHYLFNINFTCSPENVNALMEATFAEIQKIQEEGISEEDLIKIKEAQRRDWEVNQENNQYWLGSLKQAHFYGIDFSQTNPQNFIETLTSEDLQKAAQEYLKSDNYLQGVLYPKK